MVVFHLGMTYPGMSAWVYIFPKRKTGAVIMANAAIGMSFMLEIIGSITRQYRREQNGR